MNKVEQMIENRKARLNTIATPYMLRDWLDSASKNHWSIKEAIKYNDDTDRELIEMFKDLPF